MWKEKALTSHCNNMEDILLGLFGLSRHGLLSTFDTHTIHALRG